MKGKKQKFKEKEEPKNKYSSVNINLSKFYNINRDIDTT